MSISIRFGVGNNITREVSQYPTVTSILRDANLQSFMGFGSNVEGRVNGASGAELLSDGDTVDIVSKMNTKG